MDGLHLRSLVHFGAKSPLLGWKKFPTVWGKVALSFEAKWMLERNPGLPHIQSEWRNRSVLSRVVDGDDLVDVQLVLAVLLTGGA